MGAARDMVPGKGTGVTRGVKVDVGERQSAIDLSFVKDYGYALTDVAAGVRENVIAAVERMTGLEVVEVGIAVNDVHLPDEEGDHEDTEGECGRPAARRFRRLLARGTVRA
ncbi:putative alkaline shock family protein YloU [Streptomyces sp. AK010]|nr:putative alkaline shock family protein YloU [Streptomyces sp. AK010]